MRNVVLNLLRDNSGATAIEYGLIAALISVAILGVLSAVGTQLSSTFSKVSSSLNGATSS